MRFLVIGEAGIDQTHIMRHDRIAPDGAYPVGLYQSTQYNPGLASNVVANLLSLGADHVDSILSDPPLEKTRFIDASTGHPVYRGDGLPPSKIVDRVNVTFDSDAIIDTFENELDKKPDCVVVSSYDKGFLTTDDIEFIAAEAKLRDIPTIVDCKFLLGKWSVNCIIKINQKEYNAQLAKLEKPAIWCKELIVTLGAGGAWDVTRNVVIPVAPIQVADLSGCGDSFCAAFAIEYIRSGWNVRQSVDFANRAARIAASKRGVVAVRVQEVE